MAKLLLVKLSIISFAFNTVNSDPFVLFPATIIGVVSLGGAIYTGTKCYFEECCTDRWIKANISGLQHDLNTRVFGQHLVTNIVFKTIKGHLDNPTPTKALALSFNGFTGTGKTYVSRMIAENLFANGMDSKYVHMLYATMDFLHKSQLEEYKQKLQQWVLGNISACPRSLFIFEEMDKMPEGLVDVLKPFLDTTSKVAGVDCRNAMFIFISDAGASIINKEVFKNWKDGKDRSEITIKRMDEIIGRGSFNGQGGFWHSVLIKKHLIDYFVAFLPLERSHVKQCAEVELKAKHHSVDDEKLNRIADEMKYFPAGSGFLSTSGCQKVKSRVDVFA